MAKRKIKKNSMSSKKKIAVIAIVAVASAAVVGVSVAAYTFRANLAQYAGQAEHWIQNQFGWEVNHQKDEESLVVVDSTCSEEGSKTWTCKICGEEIVEVIEKKPHSEVLLSGGVPATCTQPGYTPSMHCDVCGEVTVPRVETGLSPHTEVALDAVAPTCTETGLTAGSKCGGCGEVIVAQEEIPTLDHDLDGSDCTQCDYVDLDAMFPSGYEYVEMTSMMYLTGNVFQLDSSNEGKQIYIAFMHQDLGDGSVSMLSVYLDRLEMNGETYQLDGVKFFVYEGEHYVRFPTKAENSFVNYFILDTNYSAVHVKAIEYDTEYSLWNIPESTDMSIEEGVLTFNGTGVVYLSTKDKYDNFEITFTVDEVSDVRGAFQFGIGAETTDTEIMRTTYVQFNYDRPVVVLPDGTTHNYWTNGNEWTVRVENGKLTLSCENGVICENLDVAAGEGYLILRAEASCALSIRNLRIKTL